MHSGAVRCLGRTGRVHCSAMACWCHGLRFCLHGGDLVLRSSLKPRPLDIGVCHLSKGGGRAPVPHRVPLAVVFLELVRAHASHQPPQQYGMAVIGSPVHREAVRHLMGVGIRHTLTRRLPEMSGSYKPPAGVGCATGVNVVPI